MSFAFDSADEDAAQESPSSPIQIECASCGSNRCTARHYHCKQQPPNFSTGSNNDAHGPIASVTRIGSSDSEQTRYVRSNTQRNRSSRTGHREISERNSGAAISLGTNEIDGSQSEAARGGNISSCELTQQHGKVYVLEGDIASGKSSKMKLAALFFNRDIDNAALKVRCSVPNRADLQHRVQEYATMNAASSASRFRRVIAVEEPAPLLPLFGKDPARYAFVFQIHQMALTQRIHAEYSRIAASENVLCVVDRGMLGNSCFAALQAINGLINTEELDAYMKIFHSEQHNYICSKLIYLWTSPDEAYARKQRRGRIEEESLTPDYFNKLDAVHSVMILMLAKRGRSLRIIDNESELSDIDFLDSIRETTPDVIYQVSGNPIDAFYLSKDQRQTIFKSLIATNHAQIPKPSGAVRCRKVDLVLETVFA